MDAKHGLFAFFAVGMFIVVAGCGRSEADVRREAILRVLQADKELSAQLRAAFPAATSLAEAAGLIGKYCDGMEQLDLADCPPDFRLAFRQHVRSWRASLAQLREMPDGFLEGVLIGAVNTLAGELDGGMGRLTTEMKQAESAIEETYKEVERIAAQYGAVL